MADETIISTAEELAKRMTLTSELMRQVSTTWEKDRMVMRRILAKDARALIHERLRTLLNVGELRADEGFVDAIPGLLVPNYSEADRVDNAAGDLAEMIVASLPDNAMSETLVAQMDLRPYLQLAAEQTGQGGDDANPLSSGVLARRWNDVQTQLIAGGIAPFTNSRQVSVDPTEASAPGGVDAQGNPVAVDAAGNPVDQRYATTGAGQINLGDTAYLLGTGQVAVGQLTPEQMAEPVDVGVLPGLSRPTRSSDPRVKSRALPSGATQNMTSIGGAMDWMYGLSTQEVQRLQQQLENAGYFTLVQYDAQTDQMTWTDVKYEQGYAADSATRAAWYRAISDAKAEGKSISDTLVAKRGEFASREQTVRQQMIQARQGEFDKQLGSTRGAADKIAIDTLGRRLTSEEYVRVRQYLRELQTTRVDDVMGKETGDWMTSAPMAGYTQDELAGQVADIAEPEVQQSASLAANRQLKKWLGMD